MLPTLRGDDQASEAQSTYICPPPAKRDVRAKLEKRVIPAKGKMKLRDLVNDLGGIVFWDAESRTVTAYTSDLKLELEIGNSTVKVNGKVMHTDLIPRLINDRTVVDARLYAQVRAFVDGRG